MSDDLAVYVQTFVIPAALSLLPLDMDTPAAHAQLLAIGLQESGFEHRHQVGGPALGLWQFERAGVRGVVTHRSSSSYAAEACDALRYRTSLADPFALAELHQALEHNDVLACVFARLLLWTLPQPLPRRDEPELGYLQYLAAWRPGRPHAETWTAHYTRAWELVAP